MVEALEGEHTPRLCAREAALEEERRAGSEMEGVLAEGRILNGMNGMEGARVVQRSRTTGAAPGGDRRRCYGEASWSIAGCCVSDIERRVLTSGAWSAGNWRCPRAVVGGRIIASCGRSLSGLMFRRSTTTTVAPLPSFAREECHPFSSSHCTILPLPPVNNSPAPLLYL